MRRAQFGLTEKRGLLLGAADRRGLMLMSCLPRDITQGNPEMIAQQRERPLYRAEMIGRLGATKCRGRCGPTCGSTDHCCCAITGMVLTHGRRTKLLGSSPEYADCTALVF